MSKTTPCLWFNKNAQEAVDFYISVFKNSKITKTVYYSADGPRGNKGEVLTIAFELDGVPYMALNGGIDFERTAALSLSIDCGSQDEIDYFWDKLGSGGKTGQCGWLNDKFGVYWQVASRELQAFLEDNDRHKAERVMKAMMEMQKIDVAVLRQAAETV